jgi:FkbM family methyltransferase
MTGATANIYCGLHEYVDMSFVLDTLKPGELFLDVGANVGCYTVLASKVCGAKTIAVEPDLEAGRALRRNIAINEIANCVEVVQAALGAKEGSVMFTVGQDTMNRVASPENDNVREVPITTLDQILKRQVPAIMKIDVEGYEAEVLKGGTNTLMEPNLRAIIIECLDDEVHSLLSQAGFVRAFYEPTEKNFVPLPKSASHNYLMVRGGSACSV